MITLTPFGRKVANHIISKTEFSAETIRTFTLPNHAMDAREYATWNKAGLTLRPLKLILSITYGLSKWDSTQAFLPPDELSKIVIPLSGTVGQPLGTYLDCIKLHRERRLDLSRWPDCCPESNDFSMAREYLLFLSNYGYLLKQDAETRGLETYRLNLSIENEIVAILRSRNEINSEIISEAERKIVASSKSRPNQAKFRKDVLEACKRCVITNVEMQEVLEAAHIKPYRYNGSDDVSNGFAMRMDIHYLFDSGHLRISEKGEVFLSQKARWSYGASIPPLIILPGHIDLDNLRWRWDNYNGT